jgi:hypothetical protein
MHYLFGMEVWQEDGHVFLGQGKYAVDILSRLQTHVDTYGHQLEESW